MVLLLHRKATSATVNIYNFKYLKFDFSDKFILADNFNWLGRLAVGFWDVTVCSGIVIAEEAGCVITLIDFGTSSSKNKNFNIVTEEILPILFYY